jgi:glycosyltransferase involved in cell wall biosynthesis
MRIGMIGKFPPIEGGVSMHQYWCAHSVAELGHQIHVITNAREVEPPFRMFMRPEDWLRCDRNYPGGGYVRVHWTDPYDHAQSHIPWHNPYVTKLASVAAQVIQEHDLELIFSYYLEPYGVAGYLAAEMTGRPHVLKHAGSDAGRLLLHPQMGTLYHHVFDRAARIVTGGAMAKLFRKSGLDERRLFLGDDFRVPESLFCPDGKVLDLERLVCEAAEDHSLAPTLEPRFPAHRPFLGVYGKLGEAKGTFDLLRAVKRLRERGLKFTLVVVGHGFRQSEAKFRDALAEFEVTSSVVQVPFLPHWRVPEFIRMCQTVCFLERDFPITFHAPTVPREVLACGKCLISSAELLQRQLLPERLIHGFNCLAVRDVRNTDELATAISVALDDPVRAEWVGRRGHEYSVLTESMRSFPHNYELLFSEAIESHGRSKRLTSSDTGKVHDHFIWTHRVVDSLPQEKRKEVMESAALYDTQEGWALSVYARLLAFVEKGELNQGILIDAVRMELRLEGVLKSNVECESGLFRLETDQVAMLENEIHSLCPVRAPGLEVEEYDYDTREMLAARNRGELPLWASRGPSRAAVLPILDGRRCRMFWLSPAIESLLELCDGTRTVRELAGYLNSEKKCRHDQEDISELLLDCFRLGLIRLRGQARVLEERIASAVKNC